jgi:hypothetical protein
MFNTLYKNMYCSIRRRDHQHVRMQSVNNSCISTARVAKNQRDTSNGAAHTPDNRVLTYSRAASNRQPPHALSATKRARVATQRNGGTRRGAYHDTNLVTVADRLRTANERERQRRLVRTAEQGPRRKKN